MHNPTPIFRYETDGTGPLHHRPGVLVVLLGGFIDAGNIQRVLTEHLLASGESEVVASFDIDYLSTTEPVVPR